MASLDTMSDAVKSDSGGMVTVTAWKEEDSNEEATSKSFTLETCNDASNVMTTQSQEGLPTTKCHARDHVKQLSQWFGDITTRAYRFPTQDGKELKVHEFLGESKLTYFLPQKLLEIWKQEDELIIRILEDLKCLPKETEKHRQDLIQQLRKSHKLYSERLKYIEEYDGPPFVPSTNMKRSIRDTEFMPTNLHQQRMDVMPDGKQGDFYDTTTVGTFTAFTLRYRQGGLSRLINQFEEQRASVLQGEPRTEEVWCLLTRIAELEKDIVSELESLCANLHPDSQNEFQNGANRFICKMKQLFQMCKSELVQEALREFSKVTGTEGKSGTSKKERRKSLQYIIPNAFHSFKKHRRKSAEEYKKMPMDSWVSVKSTMDSVIVNFERKVNQFIEADDDLFLVMGEIECLTKNALAALEDVCKCVLRSLAHRMVHETSPNVSLWGTIRVRRNVCFSQGLSALAVGVMSGLSSSIRNPEVLDQIATMGILADFECLLSCFGDEIAMLEDHMIILEALDRLKFRVFSSEDDPGAMPRICQTRPCAVVEVPLHPLVFGLLPREIREGALIDVKTACFNIGVNEQATLGERLGETKIQDEINLSGYEVLSAYKEEYLKRYQEPARDGSKQTLSELMVLLQQNLSLKKSRNTDILFLSSEICRLMRAFRFTTCKSSRDRTAMAVTLEQTKILQREHNLASKDFMRALDCMRTDGVRRANAIKNTGKRNYDFSTMRVMAMPRLFKPPSGCYRPI